MPILPISSGYCNRSKEIVFAKMLWGDTFKTIKCYISVMRVSSMHSIG